MGIYSLYFGIYHLFHYFGKSKTITSITAQIFMKPKQVTFYFVSLYILLRGILKLDFFEFD